MFETSKRLLLSVPVIEKVLCVSAVFFFGLAPNAFLVRIYDSEVVAPLLTEDVLSVPVIKRVLCVSAVLFVAFAPKAFLVRINCSGVVMPPFTEDVCCQISVSFFMVCDLAVEAFGHLSVPSRSFLPSWQLVIAVAELLNAKTAAE